MASTSVVLLTYVASIMLTTKKMNMNVVSGNFAECLR